MATMQNDPTSDALPRALSKRLSHGDRRRSRSETSGGGSSDEDDHFYDADEYPTHTASSTHHLTTVAGSQQTKSPKHEQQHLSQKDHPLIPTNQIEQQLQQQPSGQHQRLDHTAHSTADSSISVPPALNSVPSLTNSAIYPGGGSGSISSTPQSSGAPSPNLISTSFQQQASITQPANEPSITPQQESKSVTQTATAGSTIAINTNPSDPTPPLASPSLRPPLPTTARPSFSTSLSQQQLLPGTNAPTTTTRVAQTLPPQPQHHQTLPAAASSSSTSSSSASTTTSTNNSPHISTLASPLTTAPPTDSPFIIKNLDTGESCALDHAQSVFPEIRQAMTLTTFDEATTNNAIATGEKHTPVANVAQEKPEEVSEKKKTLGFMSRLKKALHINDKNSGSDDLPNNSVKVKTRHRSYQDLTDVKLVQTLTQHAGPVWCVSISAQGDYIATGGQDSIVRVWAVMGSQAARELDERLRHAKAQQDAAAAGLSGTTNSTTPLGNGNGNGQPAPSPSSGNVEVVQVTAPISPAVSESSTSSGGSGTGSGSSPVELPNFEQDYSKESGNRPIVYPLPFRSYAGHKADVIDLAWSKANFLLSASIDKTVRLWHVTRMKCLCVFQHADFVTAVAFHPIEDRYFVSGSFDKKLRIWNIPEHRVVEWAQTSNIITAATFNPNGNMTVAGLYNGQCVFYQTDGLKYFTQVDAKNRHGRNRKGKKVTGMQFAPDGKTLLVTTNDSRIRLYDMDDYSMIAKFKGTENDELQIRAWFNEDGSKVICGGENHHVFVWSAAEYQSALNGHDTITNGTTTTNGSQSATSSSTPVSKPDIKCDSSESFRAFSDTCTSAQFLPTNTIRLSSENDVEASKVKHLMLAAGYQGELKFFENRGATKKV